MIHLSLLFSDGHFETNPDHDFTDKPTILPYFPVLKAQDMRNSAPEQNTSFEFYELDKIISMDDDKMLINDPNHNFSDFSITTNENTGQFSVPTVFTPLCRTFLMMMLLFRKQESM